MLMQPLYHFYECHTMQKSLFLTLISLTRTSGLLAFFSNFSHLYMCFWKRRERNIKHLSHITYMHNFAFNNIALTNYYDAIILRFALMVWNYEKYNFLGVRCILHRSKVFHILDNSNWGKCNAILNTSYFSFSNLAQMWNRRPTGHKTHLSYVNLAVHFSEKILPSFNIPRKKLTRYHDPSPHDLTKFESTQLWDASLSVLLTQSCCSGKADFLKIFFCL